MDPLDDDATPEERQAALLAVLQARMAQAQQPNAADFYRGWGNLTSQSGDKALSAFGQSQVGQAQHIQNATAQAGQRNLQSLLEARQAASAERHQRAQESIANQQLAQGRWSLSNPGYGQTYKVDGKTGAVIPLGDERVRPPPGGGDFKKAENMRKEFFGNKVAKDMQDVAVNFKKVMSAAQDPSAAGDIALIYSFMKGQDPGSTVREGEFATAQNAGSIPERIQAKYNSVMRGERLTPEQRQDFIGRSKQAYDAHYSRYKPWADQFTDVAIRSGINPKDVVLDLGFEAPATGDARASVTEERALPDGRIIQLLSDGTKRVKP